MGNFKKLVLRFENPKNQTYSKQIIEVTSTRVFISSNIVFIFDNIIGLTSLLGIFDFRKSLIISLPKLGYKNRLLLF